jgi:hypothetical protein
VSATRFQGISDQGQTDKEEGGGLSQAVAFLFLFGHAFANCSICITGISGGPVQDDAAFSIQL